MARLGVQFEKPPAAVQASLDRVVFALIRRKASARRPLQDTPGAERRLAPRVEISEGDRLTAVWLPERPRGALAAAKPDQGTPVTLLDLSTTGCALGLPDPCALQVGQRLRLRLKGENLDVELWAKVRNIG